MSRRRWLIPVAVLVVAKLCLFTVDETRMMVLTSFGRPVMTVSRAGIYAKWPWWSRIGFDRRLRVYDPAPSEFLTADKKNLIVNNYVCWRIQEPVRFLGAVGNEVGAQMRLHDVVWATVSAEIGSHPLDCIVSTEPDGVATDEMMARVTRRCAKRAAADYGIEVVDVAIKRLNFPEQNKQSVFDRMRAERQRIVKQYRAEGESEAMKIRAEADKLKSDILAEAYSKAEVVKGEGDAEASRVYAAAHNADPSFYKFLRTLESYDKMLDDKTTLVLSSDSELLRLLTGVESGR